MPDLQSELAKLAHAWDSHEQQIRHPQQAAPAPTPTPEKTMLQTNHTPAQATTSASPFTVTKSGNLTRDIFNYAKNGQHTRTDIADKMAYVGYRRASVSTLISQMIKAGVLGMQGDVVVTVVPEYAPVKDPYKKNTRQYTRRDLNATITRGKAKPAKAKAKPVKAAGLAALPVVKEATRPTPEPTPARLVRLQTASDVLANLSVVEAHKLYVELSKMFGGK